MIRNISLRNVFLVLLVMALVIAVPVSAIAVLANTTAGVTANQTPAGTTTPAKAFVTATVSSLTPTVGDPLTISGTASDGNATFGIRIWVFAGNYVNVTTVPVGADGTFSKTFATAGFPAAQYYVFAQNPGPDGQFAVDIETTGVNSGEVWNTKTDADIFNFTGVGSVHDAAAAKALSDAFNQPGVDDVFTKLTFQLVAPSATSAAPAVTTVVPTTVPTTAKSPLSPVTIIAGVGIAALAVVMRSRK